MMPMPNAMQPQMGMQPPPPQPPTPEQMKMLQEPTWEQVMGLLRANPQKNYRIDIETDSTIASSIETDMVGMAQVTSSIAELAQQMTPMVMGGILPFESEKEIIMQVVRRAKMGRAVEDAIDKMQAPQPQQDPQLQIAQMKQQSEQAKMQAQAQADMQRMQMEAQQEAQSKQLDLRIEQQRLAMEAQAENTRQQNEMAVETHKQEMQAQQNAHQNQLEAQREQMRAQQDAQLQQMQMQIDERMEIMRQQFELMINARDNAAKIEVAEIGANTTLQTAQISAASNATDNGGSDNE